MLYTCLHSDHRTHANSGYSAKIYDRELALQADGLSLGDTRTQLFACVKQLLQSRSVMAVGVLV
jgi:hypothetical protein